MTKAKRIHSSTTRRRTRKTPPPSQPELRLDLVRVVDSTVRRLAPDLVTKELDSRHVNVSLLVRGEVENLADAVIDEKVTKVLSARIEEVKHADFVEIARNVDRINEMATSDIRGDEWHLRTAPANADRGPVPSSDPMQFATFTPAPDTPVVQAIHCSSCGAVHDLDATSYVTYHGRITIGESREVSSGPLRLCVNRSCWEAVSHETQAALADAMANTEVVGPRNPFPPRAGKITGFAGVNQIVGRGLGSVGVGSSRG